MRVELVGMHEQAGTVAINAQAVRNLRSETDTCELLVEREKLLVDVAIMSVAISLLHNRLPKGSLTSHHQRIQSILAKAPQHCLCARWRQ